MIAPVQAPLFELGELCQRWRAGVHTWAPASAGGFQASRYSILRTE